MTKQNKNKTQRKTLQNATNHKIQNITKHKRHNPKTQTQDKIFVEESLR